MYEHRGQDLLSAAAFRRRLGAHVIAAGLLLALSLLAGMGGYMACEHLSAMDAFLNAAMLLGGMGPIHVPVTTGGKLFAGVYALYAGLVFVLSSALILTPVAHRMLHRFHWDGKL